MLQWILNTFLWNGKHHRVSWSILYAFPNSAGLGVPEIKQYHKAILLDQLKRWCSPSPHHLWSQIEVVSTGCPPKQLLAAIWLQLKPPCTYLSTVNAAIKVWGSILQISIGLPKVLTPSLPLATLNLLCQDLQIGPWVSQKFTPLETCLKKNSSPPCMHYKQKQILAIETSTNIYVFSTPCKLPGGQPPPSIKISYMYMNVPPGHAKGSHIYNIYRILTTKPTPQKLPTMEQWEHFTVDNNAWHQANTCLNTLKCLSYLIYIKPTLTYAGGTVALQAQAPTSGGPAQL